MDNEIVRNQGGVVYPKKLLLILNPHAGLMRGKKYLSDIIDTFNAGGYLTTVFVTRKRGDACVFAYNYASEFDVVACIGGDGTFNELIDGVMQSGTKVKIGYIPAGSTNDFASSLNLSSNLVKAAQDIVCGTEHLFDVGRINGRYFSYVASFGAFTRTSYSTPQNLKNSLGYLAYILSSVKDLHSIKPLHIVMEANGRIYDADYIFGGVCNSTSLGGILTLDKSMVDMNDGLFEVIMIRMPKTALELTDIIRALQLKKYDDCRYIDFVRASDVVFRTDFDMEWSIDGEFFAGGMRTEVCNVHSAIRVLLSDDSSRA